MHLEKFEQFKDKAKQTNIQESAQPGESAHNGES